MVALWPFSFTLSGDGDYQEEPEQTTLWTKMDTGHTKSRRRNTRGEAKVSGSIVLGNSEVQSFLDFYKVSLAGGSLPFVGTLGRAGVSQVYRFTEPPVISHMGGLTYRVNLKLVAIPS